jgi:two-component system sensor histidine kinase YesM
LASEVEHARTYCEIQRMRFSSRIRIEFGPLPESFVDLQVPRLILQPIIENAFEHGLESKEADGLLRISFQTDSPGTLDVFIEDNGDTLADQELQQLQSALDDRSNAIETTGLVNIHRRIQLKFGAGSGLRARRGDLGGMEIRIRLQTGGKADA